MRRRVLPLVVQAAEEQYQHRVTAVRDLKAEKLEMRKVPLPCAPLSPCRAFFQLDLVSMWSSNCRDVDPQGQACIADVYECGVVVRSPAMCWRGRRLRNNGKRSWQGPGE